MVEEDVRSGCGSNHRGEREGERERKPAIESFDWYVRVDERERLNDFQLLLNNTYRGAATFGQPPAADWW